jgi:hypothetical protein
MLNRVVTAGTVAGATLLSPFVGAAPAASADTNATADGDSARHCVVDAASVGVAATAPRCYPTLAEALASHRSRAASIAVATHWEGAAGMGSSMTVYAASCKATWFPPATWQSTISSTRVSSSCSGAKHYTGTNCGGAYQLTDLVSPSIFNLSSPVNNNVGCVKYA